MRRAGGKKRTTQRGKRTAAVSTPTMTMAATAITSSFDSSLSLAICHVDSVIDRIKHNRLKSFDESCLVQLRKLSPKDLKGLVKSYTQTLLDLKTALAGDDYYIEAYCVFTKPQMKLIVEYLRALKTLKHDDSAKSSRIRLGNHGPRKKKEKPPEQIVAKTLYLQKDPETGIVGVSPIDILGASEVWVYNVKLRKLGCYYAASENGLSIKGTTVLNYDEDKSTTKMLRRPKQQLKEFLAGQIVAMRKYWNAIRAVPQKISPRLSRDTLILRAKS